MKLLDQHCVHGAPALEAGAIQSLLAEVPGWQAENGVLKREFPFPDYASTIAFVIALAESAEKENHHPDLLVRWGRCGVSWTTHSAGNALSLNDFISAAKTDALFAGRAGA